MHEPTAESVVAPGPVRAFLEPHHVELAARAGAFAREHIATLAAPDTDEEGRAQARVILSLLAKHDLLRFIDGSRYAAAAPDGAPRTASTTPATASRASALSTSTSAAQASAASSSSYSARSAAE